LFRGWPCRRTAEGIRGIVAAEHGSWVSVSVRTIDVIQAKLNGRWIYGTPIGLVMGDHSGEEHHGRHHRQLNNDEGYGAPVDLPRGHARHHIARDFVTIIFSWCH